MKPARVAAALKERKEALEQQKATAAILRAISRASGDPRAVFEAILQSALKLCGAHIGLLNMADGDTFYTVAQRGGSEAFARWVVERGRFRADGGLVTLARTRKPIQMADMRESDAYRERRPNTAKFVELGRARTFLGVPLLKNGKVVGNLGIYRQEVRPFTERQIALVSTFADQAVIAIENARLFNETKEALERQTASATILRAISGAQTRAEPVFAAIAHSARQLLGGLYALVVRRIDGELHLVAHTLRTRADAESLAKLFPAKLTGQGATGKAVLTGKPAWIVDVETDPAYSASFRAGARARGYRSQLTVPILNKEGESIGAITVTRREAGAFTDQQIELLQTFADQAVIAIENVRLFNETKEALEHQKASADILKIVASSVESTAPVFEAISAAGERLLPGLRVGMNIIRDGHFHHVGHAGLTARQRAALKRHFPMRVDKDSVIGAAALEKRIVSVPDIDAERRKFRRSRVLTSDASGWKAMLAVPLLHRGAAIGVLSISRTTPGPFPGKQVALAQTFADQAVIAIQNSGMFMETKEALEHQKTSAEILKIVASSVESTDPVFRAITDAGQRLVPGCRVALHLLRDGQLHYISHSGVAAEHFKKIAAFYPLVVKERNIPSANAVAEKRVVHIPDIEKVGTDLAKGKEMARVSGWRAIVSVPLLRRGEAIGNIAFTRVAPGPFSDKQIALARTFADQAVIAIENARLFNETKEALERQTATSEVLRIVSRSVADTQPTFEAILAATRRLFDGFDATVWLVKGDALVAVARDGPTVGRTPGQSVPITRDYLHGLVILDAKPICVGDVPAAKDITEVSRADLLSRERRAILMVPLLRDGGAVGALSVSRSKPYGFSARQIAVLDNFADQAVIAIENARLFNETKESLERQTATSNILAAMSGSLTDAKPVFESIVKSCSALFKDGGISLRLLREGMLHVEANVGYAPPTVPVDRTSAVGACVLDGRTIHFPDIEAAADEFPRVRELGLKHGYRSGIYTPLLRDGKAIGTISVLRPQVGAFSEKELALLKTFADQAVIAIENVRLVNETREALERQTATSEVLKTISRSTFDLNAVLQVLIENATRLAGAHQGFIFRMEGEVARLAYSYNAPAEYRALIESIPFRAGRGSLVGRVLLERRPVHIVDAVADPEFTLREAQRAGGFRSMLGVPMLREGKLIGVIAMWATEVRPFSEKQMELVSTFADQAVIAIENVRLFNETKEALEQQTATAEILKVISSSPADMQPVFGAIVHTLARLFGRRARIRLVEHGQLVLRARSDQPAPGGAVDEPLPIDRDSAGGRVVLDRLAQQIADTHAPDSPASARKWGERGAYRAIALAPLVKERSVLGVISVTSAEPGALSEKQMALLQTFADQAVIAIENVRLFNETKEALEQQTATAEILKVIASSPTDVQPVFKAIVSTAVRLCGASFGRLYRYDGVQIEMVAGHALSALGLQQVQRVYPRAASADTIVGQVILARQPFFVRDIKVDTHVPFLSRQMIEALGTRSQVVVPMLRGDSPIGAIALGWAQAGAFTEAQVALLKTFADQAVIAIENVRLFQELQSTNSGLREALEQQTATGEILGVISGAATDAQPVFETIARNAVRLCDAVFCNVVRYDGEQLHVAALHGDDEFRRTVHARYPMRPDPSQISGRVVEQKKVVHIVDAQAEALYDNAYAAKAGFRRMLAVPMLREETLLGVIIVAWRDPGGTPDSQMKLLQSFADQAVIAIENVRLFNETKEALERQTATAEVLKVIGSSPTNEQPVFDSIAMRAATLCGARFCALSRFDGESIHIAAVYGASPESEQAVRAAYPMKPGSGTLAARVIRDGRALHIADVNADPEYEGKDAAASAGFRSVLGVPMLREGTVTGAIVIAREQAGLFPADQVNLLATFADQAVIAIENVRLFREIQEKSSQLEEASKHKSQFLASMSHELRTPLNAILGFNEMLLGGVYGDVPEDMREPLKDIQTSGKHLLRLINNVLDLAKIEAGRMELALADYSVQDMVETVRSTLRPLAAEKGLEFHAAVPADLPLAHGDGGRLTQCLMNLAGNSLKFTKSGKVEIGVAQENGRIRFHVADTGIGIPTEKIAGLFTEFKQSDATIASEYGGTGLGLSITKKFVEMHGGRIWVESAVGKGSTFLFEVPLRVGA
jgi:GAF domain-containing protein